MIPAFVKIAQRGVRPRWVASVEWETPDHGARVLVALDSDRRRVEVGLVPDSAIVSATARSPLRIEIDWMAVDAAYTASRFAAGVPRPSPPG